MAISTNDIQAFIQKLESDPKLVEQLRRVLLTESERYFRAALNEQTLQVQMLSRRVDDFAEVQKQTWQAIQELAEAQKRTEQRVEELAEAQKRTEQRVEELAEAQKRTEERVGRLEIAMAELAEAQKRTEERVEELAQAQKATASQLARLENRIGVSTEQEAADTLGYVLRQKGYQIIRGPFNLPLNGEIDVIYQVETTDGKQYTAVLEAKVRLSHSAVEDWAQRMRSSSFRQKIQQAGYPGPYLVYAYGMRADPSAYDAVKRFGIGLITDRGEQIEPQGTLP